MNDPAELNVGFKAEDKRFFGMKLTYDGVGNISQWAYRNAQYDYVSSVRFGHCDLWANESVKIVASRAEETNR